MDLQGARPILFCFHLKKRWVKLGQFAFSLKHRPHSHQLNQIMSLLAFILADLGYDVWLGNTRGNIYSRAHVKYDSSRDKAYWKF